MRISFVGFGEAARAFVESLARRRVGLAFAAYDVKRTPEMEAAMRARRVRCAQDVADLVGGADWVVSAVTADQSHVAAAAAAPHMSAGQVFIDLNSVSPERKRQGAGPIEARGAAYLDMAVMAPVHPRGHATPVLLAGPEAARIAPDLVALGFQLRLADDEVGAATAIKMVRSLFVKGLEAITVETLLAAEASGCRAAILASLSQSYPGLGWPEHPAYCLERTRRHGARRAAEMHESAATLRALGLHGALAAEIAAVQARMGAAGPDEGLAEDLAGDLATDLGDAVARALGARRRAEGAPRHAPDPCPGVDVAPTGETPLPGSRRRRA